MRPAGLGHTQDCPWATGGILVLIRTHCFPFEYFITSLEDRPEVRPHGLDEEMEPEKGTGLPKAAPPCPVRQLPVPKGRCAGGPRT